MFSLRLYFFESRVLIENCHVNSFSVASLSNRFHFFEVLSRYLKPAQ